MNRDETWLLSEKYDGVETAEYMGDKRRLALSEPLAYIIGHQPFLGLKMYLDSRPLIPRPETEWWTEQLIKTVPSAMNFLDLCAGSGAIGCAALSRLPDAKVYFGEIDPAHEMSIRKNIQENNLDKSRATIGIGDLFEPFRDMRFDVVAANPPYVPSGRELPVSVSLFEPALALRAGSDGLDILARIARELPRHLSPTGTAWIECDRGHAEEAKVLFEKEGFQAEIRSDQYGKPRIIVVSFP